ncbi:hypothetical protein PHSC3_001715 [Chlamydiales bacterium STE3]|nr:hypothetical protein PHSC3_001715 [Chlamydiales bacterium STE3]
MNQATSVLNSYNSETFSIILQRISEYLSPYKEFKRFNVQSPEDASIYLVAEEHSDQESHIMQASLINYLASQGPVIVLHEGLESGEILGDEFKDGILNIRLLDPSYKNNITVVGWDVSEELLRSIGTPEHALDQIAKNVLETESESRILSQKINEIAPGILKAHLDKNIKFNIFITLEAEKRKLLSELITEWARVNEIVIDGMQKYNELKKNSIKEGAIKKTFPQRTEAMISSLRQIDTIKKNLGFGDVKVVLIAGIKHLKTDKEDIDSPNHDLSNLYVELEKHKSVILIPPHIWE